jgi:uncharacterized membrane protein
MADKRSFMVRRWRLLLGTCVGIAAGVGAHFAGLLPGASTLVGWNVGCLTFLTPTGWLFAHADEEKVRRNACEEDESRIVILLLVLFAVAASFGAIVVALREAKGAHAESPLLVAGAILTIAMSWLLVQAIFCIHYAHKYFGDRNDDGHVDRGLKFEGDQPSSYMDFVYVSVCMGATFQVSDFNTTNTRFRNLVTLHALVAFAFNTLVLALGVNIAASLMGQ